MKEGIAIFLTVFVLMFCVGFGSHWPDAKKPDSLKNYAFSYVRVLQKDNKCVFVYGPKDKTLYWYDIDKNSLYEGPNKAIGGSLFHSGMSFKEGHLDWILEPDLIGALSRNVATDILIAVATGLSSRNIITTVLGHISGYSFGYWVATKAVLRFDSPEIICIVASTDTWIGWERYVLGHFYLETRGMVAELTEGDVKDTHIDTLGRVLWSINERADGDIGSSDLSPLLNLYNALKNNQEGSS